MIFQGFWGFLTRCESLWDQCGRRWPGSTTMAPHMGYLLSLWMFDYLNISPVYRWDINALSIEINISLPCRQRERKVFWSGVTAWAVLLPVRWESATRCIWQNSLRTSLPQQYCSKNMLFLQVLTRWKEPLLGLVLDSTFDKLATEVHRFPLVRPKGHQHVSCRESSLLRYQFYG